MANRRATALFLLAAGAIAVATLALLRPAPRPLGDRPDAAIVWACTWLAWLLAGYLAVGLTVATGWCLAGSRQTRLVMAVRLLAPAMIRRAVEVALGAGVAAAAIGSGTSGAWAAAPTPPPVHPAHSPPASLDWPRLSGTGAMRTTRPPAQRPPIVAAPPAAGPPAGAAPSSAPAATAAATPAPTGQAPAVAATDQRRTVTVRPGDSLWQIAARSLGARASDAAVAAAWPRWWATNRDVIGADPDLIHPGEQLTPPAATPSARP